MVTKDLIILGVGGNSIEVSEAVQELKCWNLLGFLDDDTTKHGQIIGCSRVLGPIASAANIDCSLVCALGSFRNIRIRQDVIQRLDLHRERYVSIIHPRSEVSRYAKIGIGTIVLAGAMIGARAEIGNHVFVLQGAQISHDCIIGDYTTITGLTGLAGSVKVGQSAYIGMGSMLLNGVSIGEGALIGIGSTVTRDVAPNTVVFGNPARSINHGTQSILVNNNK